MPYPHYNSKKTIYIDFYAVILRPRIEFWVEAAINSDASMYMVGIIKIEIRATCNLDS